MHFSIGDALIIIAIIVAVIKVFKWKLQFFLYILGGLAVLAFAVLALSL